MRTKTSDRPRLPVDTVVPSLSGPTYPDTVAYWLEDDRGQRVSKLCATSDAPLRLAGRVLENVGSLQGWSVARRAIDGMRHVIASGADLEALATAFMPVRSPAEAASTRRLNAARRAIGFRRSKVDTDEPVY